MERGQASWLRVHRHGGAPLFSVVVAPLVRRKVIWGNRPSLGVEQCRRELGSCLSALLKRRSFRIGGERKMQFLPNEPIFTLRGLQKPLTKPVVEPGNPILSPNRISMPETSGFARVAAE